MAANRKKEKNTKIFQFRPIYVVLAFLLAFFVMAGVYLSQQTKMSSIQQQKEEIDTVKRSENGVIRNPFFLHPENYVYEADQLMAKYKISGVPICSHDGTLVGIITNRDLRFMTDFNVQIDGVMTKDNLVTVPVGTTLEEARDIVDMELLKSGRSLSSLSPDEKCELAVQLNRRFRLDALTLSRVLFIPARVISQAIRSKR
jgi:hypothetical protein